MVFVIEIFLLASVACYRCLLLQMMCC